MNDALRIRWLMLPLGVLIAVALGTGALGQTPRAGGVGASTATCTGDVNGDGVVNLMDAALVAFRLGARAGDGRYEARYDLNADGRITAIDVYRVVIRIGTRCTTPTPTGTVATSTLTATKTQTATPWSSTSTPSATATATATVVLTFTPTPTATATVVPTSTHTATPTDTATATATATAADTATATNTASPTTTATPTDTATATATPTSTPLSTATPTATATPGNGLPPDPADVAPPIDPTEPMNLLTSTEFLYTGDNPIQTGVTPGTFDIRRIAVLRGQAFDRDGAPLPGVRINVLGHGEFGQTLTRDDGMFDLAVNGGGQITIHYEKSGFIPVQRQVDAPWQDFLQAPDVTLLPFDAAVTQVTLGAGAMQTARGSGMTDGEGTRRATILIPASTTAQLVLPNGSLQAVSALNIRATEFTVGAGGPQAMPAVLPPNSGYTYAVELSADEAVAANARAILFSGALPVYLENFLEFPVGAIVPSGYYDRLRGEWVGSPNGRVIKIINVTSGSADLDVTGDDVADTGAALTSLGVTDAERAQLGTLYAAGQSLWRVPVTHFTPWDFNFPFGPPDDFGDPPSDVDEDLDVPNAVDDPCIEWGSIIGCENQSLGESLPLVGTEFSLSYISLRVPGRKDAYAIEIPVSGATVPASVARIRVEVMIAGKVYAQTLAPAPNLTHTVVWDGLDAYGRRVQGSQRATVQLHYDFRLQRYATPAAFGNAWARAGLAASAFPSRSEETFVTATSTWTRTLGVWDGSIAGYGGWGLSPHHVYEPNTGTLLLGDGAVREAGSIGAIVNTVAGDGEGDSSIGGRGDGGSALAAGISEPYGIDVAPDGTVYIADRGASRVRRVTPDGTITTFAGSPGTGFFGDGGQASAALLANPWDVAVAPDGSVYIADSNNGRVRRVATNGVISTIAGSGPVGYTGDGGPATSARLSTAAGVAVGPDGTLYIAELTNHVIRRVGTDGIITTAAGTGVAGYTGDGGPATLARLSYPQDIAVGSDGSLYIADGLNNRIRRVAPDGTITTIGGSGSTFAGGDGGAAVDAGIPSPTGVDVGPDGSVYVVSTMNASQVVRQIGADGVIRRVAGNGATGAFGGELAPATAQRLAIIRSIDIGPDGNLYIPDYGAFRVRRISPAMPSLNVSDISIPSEDGSELYVFTSVGRHLRTHDTLTGAVRYEFAYDSDGYLTAVTDSAGLTTMIERSGATPLSIVAPGGQRTELTVNADGWLASVTNPTGEAHTMTYSPDGLLATMTDPRSNEHRYIYDGLGRLTLDEDPAGGSTTLSRTDFADGFTVTTTSALGTTDSHRIERLSDGRLQRTVTAAGGVVTTMIIDPASGRRELTYPDGVRINTIAGPDPRFGMLAPRLLRRERVLPGGQTEVLTTQRTATLITPLNILGLATLADSATINGTRVFTRTYDGPTRTLTETSAEGRVQVTVLDALGRIESHVAAPGLTPITFTYDARGRLSEERQGVLALTYGYDARDRIITRTDAAGHVTAFAYDDADRVMSQTLPSGRVYEFAYDPNGNRIGVTLPGGQDHTLGHTAIDLESSYTPPGAGSYTRSFNVDRELTGTTLPGGRSTSFNLDAADRIADLSYPEGSTQFIYANGDGTDRAQALLHAQTGASQDMAYAYNGSAITTMSATGASPYDVAYSYNSNFFPTNVTLTSGADSFSSPLTFDRDGLPTSFGPMTFVRTGPAGTLASAGDATGASSYGYDAFGRAASRGQAVSGTQRYAATLSYDAAGRLTGKTEAVAGTSHAYVYTYDLDGQLTRVDRDTVTVEAYAYDLNGNRTSSHAGAAPAEVATYDAQDRLTQRGAMSYTVNDDGFLAQRGGDTFTYDARGQLLGANIGGQAIAYAYDGLGRRVSRTDASGTYRYMYADPASGIVTATRDQAGVFSFYYYDTNGMLIAFDRAGARYYVATDQVGSPRVVTSAAGAVVRTIEHDTFGQVIADSNQSFDLPIGYAGGLADSATDLVRFGARDYEPASGRWTARDPVGFDGGQGNLYAYVGNSPATHRDPTGLFCVTVTAYSGVGGGVTTCITSDGASVCGEVGFGIGASAGVDSAGLDETGFSVLAEATAQGGPLKIGGGVSLDSAGCLKSTGKGQIGPANYEVDLKTGSLKKGGLKLKVEGAPSLGSAKAQVKAAAKGCYQGRW